MPVPPNRLDRFVTSSGLSGFSLRTRNVFSRKRSLPLPPCSQSLALLWLTSKRSFWLPPRTNSGFELPFVQPGSYTVVIRHPVLDSLGIRHLARTVEVDAGQSAALPLRFPTNQELAGRLCDKPVDFARHSVIRFLIVDQAGAPLANTPAVFSRVPLDSTGRPVADSATAWDVKLDAGGGFLGCALRGDEIVRIEAVPESGTPWGETVRPRVGLIGWHVVRIGKRR